MMAKVAEKIQEEEAKETDEDRRIWIRDWIARRQTEVPLFAEVQSEDREKFFSDFRLYPEDFEKLLVRYILTILEMHS